MRSYSAHVPDTERQATVELTHGTCEEDHELDAFHMPDDVTGKGGARVVILCKRWLRGIVNNLPPALTEDYNVKPDRLKKYYRKQVPSGRSLDEVRAKSYRQRWPGRCCLLASVTAVLPTHQLIAKCSIILAK